jgi:hypothetical protein
MAMSCGPADRGRIDLFSIFDEREDIIPPLRVHVDGANARVPPSVTCRRAAAGA